MIILINTFHLDPENQQRAIELLSEVTRSSVRGVPGFISARLHRSLDGTRVTMYATWSSQAEYEAMRSSSVSGNSLAELMSFARFEPGMYDLVEEFPPRT